MRRLQLQTFTLSLILLVLQSQLIESLRFEDVTKKFGLQTRPNKKYGGASVYDYDLDGRPDIIFFHHDRCCGTIHFNNGPNKKFTAASERFWWDAHGVIPFQPSPIFTKRTFAAVSIGGGNGNAPATPPILEINARTRKMKIQSKRESLFPASVAGRGRSVLFTHFRNTALGAIMLNAPGRGKFKQTFQHKAIEWDAQKGRFRQLKLQSPLGNDGNYHGGLTDIDNDRIMEVFTMEHLRMFKMTYRTKNEVFFKQISKQIGIPKDYTNRRDAVGLKGVAAVSEIDFNNDGFWDLYVARSSQGDLKWLRLNTKDYYQINDVLLINQGGKRYTDRKMSNILASSHRGVTSGDFNNDGYIDLYVSSLNTAHDYLLLNNFGTSFTIRKFKRFTKGPGDMATAFDFNNNGYLDLIVSTGDWHETNKMGSYTLLRNTGFQCWPNYLYVRVLNSPKFKVTNLHAVVKVKLKGRKGVMMRRVGGNNGVNTGVSLLANVHFGLGKWTSAEWILVTWSNGEERWFSNVKSKSTVVAGR